MSPQIVTDLRSITSAANGARSHGPVTAEGKARSSRNSEKHGMYSRYILLPHESPEAYEELRQRYYADLAPANETQAKLVDRMVASVWRLRRLASLESSVIDIQCSQIDATSAELAVEACTHFAFNKLITSSQTLTIYNRFESSQARCYDRALRKLRLMQAGESRTTKHRKANLLLDPLELTRTPAKRSSLR